MTSEREKGLAFSSTLTVRRSEECNGVSGASVPLKVLQKMHVFYSIYMVERGSLGDFNIVLFFQFLTWTVKT